MLRIKQEELQRGPLTGVLLSHIPVTLSRYSLSLKVSLMVENKDDVTSCKDAIIIVRLLRQMRIVKARLIRFQR